MVLKCCGSVNVVLYVCIVIRDYLLYDKVMKVWNKKRKLHVNYKIDKIMSNLHILKSIDFYMGNIFFH